MTTEKTETKCGPINQEPLIAFVRAMIGGSRRREDDEHPLPPGPWDPVIRIALDHIHVFGPHPEPWTVYGQGVPWRRIESGFGHPVPWKVVLANLLARHPELWEVIGGGPRFGDEVALNPQPLPPRFAFLLAVAQTVISRAELLQDLADATRREGEQQGIIIVSGLVARFVDDWCGTAFKLRFPFPGPTPPWWFADGLNGIDLVIMATQFDHAAKEAFNRDLRRSLADASAKLAEAGLVRMR